jgi:hypothetical protein
MILLVIVNIKKHSFCELQGVSDDIDSGTSDRGSRSNEEGGGARSMAIRMAEKTSSFLNDTLVSSKVYLYVQIVCI